MDLLEQYRQYLARQKQEADANQARVDEQMQPGLAQMAQGYSDTGTWSGLPGGIMSILGGAGNVATGFVGGNVANLAPELVATQGGAYEENTGRDKMARDIALMLQLAPLANQTPAIAGPKMRNNVVEVPYSTEGGGLLSGRLPASQADVTHGYRSMSDAELAHAQRTGGFHPPKNPKFNPNEKWWSPGDEAGSFGRTWKGGDDAPIRVRVPVSKIPEWGPARISDAEILDKLTKQYIALSGRGK